MSQKFPIISVTGSSGAGTTTVKHTFEQIFRREGITAAFIEGDAFHGYDRVAMKKVMAEEEARGNNHFSHFGPEANLLERLEESFRSYGASGKGKTRRYVHDRVEEEKYGAPAGISRSGRTCRMEATSSSTKGFMAPPLRTRSISPATPDLKIGVVPVINLEWTQKLHRDRASRGYTAEDVTKTILRRMPDYISYICPQFSETDINFQRVPTVDTSNPFIARWIPTPDELMVVIRFKSPRGIDFAYLKTMIADSFMSRANSIVIPGGKLDLAMQLILTPMIHRLVELKRRAS